MSQTGQIVQVRVLGDPCSVATGKVCAVLAPASKDLGELVELDTDVVGYVCLTAEDITHHRAVLQPDQLAPSSTPTANATTAVTLGDIPASGAHLHVGTHVEVQCLDSQSLEHGRVADVFDATPGPQPIVKLESGTMGAVTCMESPRLPDRATCVHLLRSNPLVVATPLGTAHSVLCRVTSVLNTPGPNLVVTARLQAPPRALAADPAEDEEITASLTSFLVPFTPSPSLASSATRTITPTPELTMSPPLPSPSPSATHSRPMTSPSPERLPVFFQSAPILSPAPGAVHTEPVRADPLAAAARGYSSAVSHATSPSGTASPNFSTTGSCVGPDALQPPAGPAAEVSWHYATPPGPRAASPPGGASPARDLTAGMRALSFNAPPFVFPGLHNPLQSGVGSTLGHQAAEFDRAGAGLGADDGAFELAHRMERAGVGGDAAPMLPAEDEMAPKLALLREACTRLKLSRDRAETLVMLVEGATVPQVIDALQKYTENFEAAANHLMNIVAMNSGLDSRTCSPDGMGSPDLDRDWQAPRFPWQQPTAVPTAGPGPAATSDARAVAASQDAWGGEAVPPRRRKKKGKGKSLSGCFEATPTPYAGTVSRPGPQQSLAAVVRSSTDPGAAAPVTGKATLQRTQQSKRAAVATAFDDSLPDFLLPFIAEHVRAVEAAATTSASAAAAPRQDQRWTKVKGKRSPDGKAPRTAANLVTLQSNQFREHCMKELGLIAERTTERLRLLTLCSTAANQRRIYDKSVVHRLEDCTSWINRAKEAIVKAHIIAARNTQLSNVPGVIDLHLMDMPTAEQVIQGSIYELQRNLQTGDVQVITGIGNHSHNNKANLKPLVLKLIAGAGLNHTITDRNPGMIVMHVRP